MQNHTFMQYVLNKAYQKRQAVTGTLELTARCNFSCKMCYIHRAANDSNALRGELPTEFWQDMIAQVCSAGTLTMLITGGEPLLRGDFKEIFIACKKAGLVTTINTNASLLTAEHLELFQAYPPARVNVSLYGASAETYKALCGNGDMYKRVIDNILLLKDANIPVKINYTVTAENQKDLAAVYNFGNAHTIPVQHATYMFPAVRACENGACESGRMSPEEAAARSIDCDKARFPAQVFEMRQKAFREGSPLVEPPEYETLRAPGERIFCRAGTSSYWISYDGRLLPCGMMHIPAVSLREMRFSDAWEELKKQTDQIRLPAACSNCSIRKFCEVCAAVCYAEGGSFDAQPQYMCRKTAETVRLMQQEETEGQ